MITAKLTPEQLNEVEAHLRHHLLVGPLGEEWQVRTSPAIDGCGQVMRVSDELSAFVLRDDMIAAVMAILRRTNRPPFSGGAIPNSYGGGWGI